MQTQKHKGPAAGLLRVLPQPHTAAELSGAQITHISSEQANSGDIQRNHCHNLIQVFSWTELILVHLTGTMIIWGIE